MKCKQCGSDQDLMIAFTKYQICGKCTRKNHNLSLKIEQLAKQHPDHYQINYK